LDWTYSTISGTTTKIIANNALVQFPAGIHMHAWLLDFAEMNTGKNQKSCSG
jgi:hypothetical protein